MKRLTVTWLFTIILIVSCEKSANDNSSPAEQESKSKAIGWHSYSVIISPVNEINPTCSDLMLNVSTDKNAKGKIVLTEFEGPYHKAILDKWEATNTNNVMMNTGKRDSLQRYFNATFIWGSTIIIGGKTVGMESCVK